MAALAFALGAAPAAAGRFEAALQPGYSIPVGLTADAITGSFHLKGSAGWRLLGFASAGLEVGYGTSHKLEGISGGFPFTSDSEVRVFHAAPYVRVGAPLRMLGRLLSYETTVGMGLYHIDQSAGTASFATLNRLVDVGAASNGYYGVNAGFLLAVEPPGPLRVGLDWRYHHILSPGDDDAFIIPGVRLDLRF